MKKIKTVKIPRQALENPIKFRLWLTQFDQTFTGGIRQLQELKKNMGPNPTLETYMRANK
jgi:hypothetical protein